LLRDANAMVASLAEKLKSRPNDAKGWRMLGWSYVQLGRTDEGVEALKHAVTLDAENGALRSQLGEALVQQANGNVTPGAMAAFDEALKRDAKDPRARFYKGLAQQQAGKDREALNTWVALLREGPRDAEWFAAIQTQARALATKLNLDPATAVP
jgi:cytochrome c-type biogenesis protein CcmH